MPTVFSLYEGKVLHLTKFDDQMDPDLRLDFSVRKEKKQVIAVIVDIVPASQEYGAEEAIAALARLGFTRAND